MLILLHSSLVASGGAAAEDWRRTIATRLCGAAWPTDPSCLSARASVTILVVRRSVDRCAGGCSSSCCPFSCMTAKQYACLRVAYLTIRVLITNTGVNLKPAGSMKTMKADMAGSAAALGTLLALTQTSESLVPPFQYRRYCIFLLLFVA